MMSNEIFFLTQVLLCLACSIWAGRLGAFPLTALIALQGVLANLFVLKQIELFGLTVTASDVFAVGGILGLNLLQEYFGKEAAKQAIRSSLFTLLFFVAVSQIHLWYFPAPIDQTHAAFETVLSSAPRIVIASLVVYYLVQKIDVALFGLLKQWFGDRRLGFRMGLSLLLTQGIDTVLFAYLGLYGLVASIFDVILVSFLIKCLVIAGSTPLISLSRRFMRKMA